jgi:hypothetical protein
MELTKEQMETVRDGKPVRLNEEGTELVVVRADVFERLRDLRYDDEPWSDEEMDLLAAEDADSLGWEGMDAYQGEDQ